MFILGIVSAGLVLVALVSIISRLMLERRFTIIQQEPEQTILFRRKVTYLKKIEQEKHLRYLLFTGFITGLAFLLFASSFLMLVTDYQQVKRENTHLETRVVQLEKKQKQLARSIPLKTYPKEGVGLKDYDWEKLMIEKKNVGLREQIEDELSQKLFQYVGTSDTALSLAIPKTMALHLEGQAEDRMSQETIKNNINAFVKEAEAVSELTQIQVRMIMSVGKEKKSIYSVNYSRDTAEEPFNKQNVSEENLKNNGGKG